MRLQFIIAKRYLLGRKLRTFLTTLAIVIGVGLLFGLNSVLPSMLQAFKQNTLAAAGKVDLSVTSKTEQTFDPSITKKIRDVEGISAATPSLQMSATLTYQTGATVISIVGTDVSTVQKVSTYSVSKGRFLKTSDKNKIALSKNLADTLKLNIGDDLVVPSANGKTKLEVIGLLDIPSVPGIEQVFVPLKTAQEIFGIGNKINNIDAAFEVGADRSEIQKEVKKSLGQNYKIGTLSSSTELFASIRSGQFAYNLFGIMALAMGTFIIVNTFRTAVAERRHDIGMLRAIGASRRTIIGSLLAEGLLQGVIGTVIGLAVGYGFVVGVFALLAPIFEEVANFSIDVKPVVEVGTIIWVSALGIGVAVIGALAPAISASRITPVEALRPALGEKYERAVGKRSWIGVAIVTVAVIMLLTRNMGLAGLSVLLFLTGIILVAPALIKPISDIMRGVTNIVFKRESLMVGGNVTRQPNRSAITASAVMISLAVVISLIGIITSIFIGFTNYLDKSMGSDFLVIPRSIILTSGNVGASSQLKQKIKNIDGVGAVSTLRVAKTRVDETTIQAIGIEPKSYTSLATLDFSKGSTKTFKELDFGRYAIANGIYAGQNGLSVDDKIKLQTPKGEKEYKIVGIGSDYLNAKLSTIYISQKNLSSDFDVKTDLMILVNSAKGADKARVQSDIKEVISGYPAFSLFDKASWRSSQMKIFNQSMGFMYFLVIILALPTLLALINTLTINVVARIHELGMIRAVGGTRGQIRQMILAESLMLSAIGTGFGIPAGLWLGYVLVGVINSAAFKIPYYFPWMGIWLAIAAGLIFGVLASVIPARQASRLNIVQALHYE